MARVFLSYAHADGRAAAEHIVGALQAEHDIWLDRARLHGGVSWSGEIESQIDSREIVLALLSRGSYDSPVCRGEQLRALRKGKRVIPVKVEPAADVPVYLEASHFEQYSPSDLTPIAAAIAGSGSAAIREKFRTTYNTVPDLQRDTLVARPKELDELRAAVLSDFGERQVAVVAVKAMGGIGKTVLAQMLGHDPAIQDAFPDGVLWVTVGENPTNEWLIEQMREIGKALQASTEGFDSLTGCANRLRIVLKDKAALVILDDVWRVNDARHFLADSSRSRTLITTREKPVAVGLNAREFPLEALTEEQARKLLSKWSGVSVGDLPREAGDVIRRCGRLPLGVAMCGAMVREGYAWFSVAADLARVEAEFAGYPHRELFAAIRVSVDRLTEELRERYLDFAMFPPDLGIRPQWLKPIWGADEAELERSLVRLSGASLLTMEGDRVVLHDVQHAYCTSRRPDEEVTLIQGAMRLASHVLSRDPDAFVSQMIGRLQGLDATGIQDLVVKLTKAAPAVWIEPGRGALAAPGGALVRTMAGHSDSVHAVAVTPNGRFAISGSFDMTLRVWNLAAGAELCVLQGHSGAVFALAAVPDGRFAVSGSGDKTLKVWNLATGAERLTLRGHLGSVSAVAVTSNGRFIVSGSDDQTLKVWDFATGAERLTLRGHLGSVSAVAVTPDGRFIVSGSDDRTLKAWDLATGANVRTLKGHLEPVRAVAVTPNGRFAVSGSGDKTLKVWDLVDGRELVTFRSHSSYVVAVAVTSDGRFAVSGSGDKTLKVWDLVDGRELVTLRSHSSYVRSVALTSDGRFAISGSGDQTVKIWDLGFGGEHPTPSAHSGLVNGVAVTPDGRLAVSGAADKALKVWKLTTGEEILTLRGHLGSVRAVAVTPDGRFVVSGSLDETLKVWDLATGEKVFTLKGHLEPVRAVAVTSNGRFAVSGSLDETLKIWDLVKGAELSVLQGHSGAVNAVALTQDGRFAISGSSDNTLIVWDLVKRAERLKLNSHSASVNTVAVTPDGSLAVSGSSDKTLKVWNLATGIEHLTFRGHSASVKAVALTSDGRFAVSGANDYSVKVWHVSKGVEIAHLAMDSAIYAVTLTPDGKIIVGGDATGRVHFLKLHGLS